MGYYSIVVLLVVLKLCGLTCADCYPGDSQYTAIVQGLYNKVTSDRISGLRGNRGPLTRSQLCNLLVNNHNNVFLHGSGQRYTNQHFLGQSVSMSSCVNALTNTKGYDTENAWNTWVGHHKGKWWSIHGNKVFNDGARWYHPYLEYNSGQAYAVQKVEFFSQSKNYCTHVDITGATCRYGWRQSGNTVRHVWGWDPKNNNCPQASSRGHTGAHVGFTFKQGSASCIIWVTSDEAFLECIKSGWYLVRKRPFGIHRYRYIKRRSGCMHDGSGYGQWDIY